MMSQSCFYACRKILYPGHMLAQGCTGVYRLRLTELILGINMHVPISL